MAPATMQYSELFDAVCIAANEADDYDGEHAYYVTWNQVLVHLCLLIKDKGQDIRLATGPQPCLSRKVFFNKDGPVNLSDVIGDTDPRLTRNMHSIHPSTELHKLHVEFDRPLPSNLVPNDSLSDIGAFDDSINLTDNQFSAVSTEESASTATGNLKATDERRLPDFLVFAYVLRDNHWTRYVMLIVEIKDMPFLVETDPDSVSYIETYKKSVRTEMAQMYFQVRTQAQLVFHENRRQSFVRALCVVGLFWTMIEFTRDRLPALPASMIWEQDTTEINPKDEITLKTRVHGIFDDDTQTSYSSALRTRFRQTFTKFKKSIDDLN